MKYLYPTVIIFCFTFLGELLTVLLPFPIPASVYGLLLLFLALCTGLVKLEKIEKLGNVMIGLLPLLFVAPVVNLLGCWDVIRRNLLPIALVIALSTVLVFAVSGKLTQFVLDRKGEKE